MDMLLIENDPATVRLIKEAFREAGMTKALHSVPNGEEALMRLRGEGPFAMEPEPEIIFLDLHLPKKTGLQILREIKTNPKLKVTPVVVVSGSDNPAEIREAYELHASCYIRKPDNLPQFLHFVRVCYEFWGSVVTLPAR